jgi:hypothetical protein
MIRWAGVFLCMLFLACYAPSQTHKPQPAFPRQFLLGRHTWVDFGPPLDYYELISVETTATACAIKRIMITPEAMPCWQPPTVKISTGSIDGSIANLLGKNPCLIPEKDLRREQKRCNHCLKFGGAEVLMQVPCGGQPRKIRVDILDRDLFDPNPRTPEHTSWTMSLLGRIDEVLGDNVMDRPIFSLNENVRPPESHSDRVLGDIAEGKYDDFFAKAPDKLSGLVRDAQIPPPIPSVTLTSSAPLWPAGLKMPVYPVLAKLARVEGDIDIDIVVEVAADGGATNLRIVNDKPLLRGAVEQAVSQWKFPVQAAGKEIPATISFKTNCPAPHHP